MNGNCRPVAGRWSKNDRAGQAEAATGSPQESYSHRASLELRSANARTSWSIADPYEIPNAPGVYAIFNDLELLYIGSAVNLRVRLLEQGIGRRWSARLKRFSFATDLRVKLSIDTKAGRPLMREHRLIRRLRPTLNVAYARSTTTSRSCTRRSRHG